MAEPETAEPLPQITVTPEQTPAPAPPPAPAAAPAAADQMPSADKIKRWLDTNQPGTREYTTMKQAYDAIMATPAANTAGPRVNPEVPAPVPTSGPGAVGPRVGKDPRLLEPTAPRINYDAPVEDIRSSLSAVQNEPSRQAGWNRWADFQEQKANQQGGVLRGANDWMRAVAQGVPGGTWGDEANAAVHSILPGFAGGMPYEEKLALERARNRRFAHEHPYGNIAANLGGALGSAVVGAPYTTITKGGALAKTLGNTGIDMLIAAIQGAGDADQGGSDRLRQGAASAGITAPFSLAINNVLHGLSKYGISSDTVTKAADALGIDLPAFIRSGSTEVQAAGRRFAQTSLDHPVNLAWRASKDATDQAAAAAATRAAPGTGDVMTAPYRTGQQLAPSLEAVADAAQTQKGVLARESAEQLPPGIHYDTPQARANAEAAVAQNASRHAVDPEAGLGDQLNMVRQPPPDPSRGPFAHYGPGGTTWPGMEAAATDIGQIIKHPDVTARPVDKGQLSYIMHGLRDDQRAIMRRDAGPWGEATFTENLKKSGKLSELQSSIKEAMGSKPEEIVNLAHNAATVKGAGTNMDALQILTESLGHQDRVALGGGVLAKIVSESGGSPAKLAKALEAIPDEAAARLFPAGTQLAEDVKNLRTVTGRMRDVNELQSTGSAGTLGQAMAIASKYGGIGLGSATAFGLYQSGYPGAASGVLGAVGAGRYGMNRFVKPFMMRQGINPAIQTGMDAARGMARGGTQQLPLVPPSEPDQ